MMYLYLVSRTDTVCYDEFDGFVVAAISEGRAIEMAKDREPAGNLTCERIGFAKADTEPGVILESFNAG